MPIYAHFCHIDLQKKCGFKSLLVLGWQIYASREILCTFAGFLFGDRWFQQQQQFFNFRLCL